MPLYESVNLTEEEVIAYLTRINPNKAPGPDGLGGRLLKECTQQLRGVITMLFQHLLNTRNVPHILEMIYYRSPTKETKRMHTQ